MKFNSNLDNLDLVILDKLQSDSSISNAELARQVELSAPAIHARIKRLEQLGYISRYAAILDRESLGFDMLCFIQVSLQVHQTEAVEHLRECIYQMPEVLECHHITGDVDYILKVIVPNRAALQRFLMDKLTPIPGIARIQTSIVLSEIKSTTVLPLEVDHQDGIAGD